MDIKKLPDALLTLFNEYGESYSAGAISTFTKTNSKVKMRWECDEPMQNNSPFTHAALHVNNKIVNVSAIVPFEPGQDARSIELELAI